MPKSSSSIRTEASKALVDWFVVGMSFVAALTTDD